MAYRHAQNNNNDVASTVAIASVFACVGIMYKIYAQSGSLGLTFWLCVYDADLEII